MDGGKRPGLWRVLLVALVLFALTGSSFLAGFGVTWFRQPRASADSRLPLVWEAWSYLERYFYGTVPASQELLYGMIDGALATLEDPYTRLLRPVANVMEQDRLRGSFGGIGAVVHEQDGALILRPLPESPAEKAGILEGDRLLAVDGVALPEGADTDLAVSRLRGQVGTTVTIELYRPATSESLTFSVERTEVPQPTVDYRLIENGGESVGYLHISLFGEKTAAEVQRALASVRRDGATKLLLDLRDNPGGLLDSAVEVSSDFLDEGTVLYEVSSNGSERRYSVRPRATVIEPLVVLVNRSTASAAEIVAGALQDHGRAQLVGETTRGKGSVQLAYQLSDGSSLHVTSALWLTPNHREINGVGLDPDLVVEPTEGGADVALERALEVLSALEVAG